MVAKLGLHTERFQVRAREIWLTKPGRHGLRALADWNSECWERKRRSESRSAWAGNCRTCAGCAHGSESPEHHFCTLRNRRVVSEERQYRAELCSSAGGP